MKRVLALVLLGGITLGAAGSASTKPATATTGPAAVDVEGLVRKLGAADYAEREEAGWALEKAYAKHAAEIEAASRRQGLDAQVEMALRRIVAEQGPRVAARQRRKRAVAESDRINTADALKWYEKVGKHDPAWDATVREFIETYASPTGEDEEGYGRWIKLDEIIAKLNAAGCDDPLVRYFVVRVRQHEPTADQRQCALELKGASAALEASEYPAQRKCFAHARYVQSMMWQEAWNGLRNWKRELGAEVDRAVAEWPEAVKDPAMTDYFASDLANAIAYDWLRVKGTKAGKYGDRGRLCDKLFPAWSAARPTEPGAWAFKGTQYVNYAWDARGNGLASTVTDKGRTLMAERLKVAQEALEHAYKLDPRDPRAPTEMLAVELGQGEGRARMETWWKRAMEADPDNYQACTSKLYYLEPKWYGSPDEMIAFGRECVKGGNWEGRIPFVLRDAHWTLAGYAKDPDAYFARTGVWQDIRSVYEPYLARHPESAFDRSYYAYYATRCGQWAEARKQFELLGDKPELTPFGSRQAYDYLVQKAKTMAGAEGAGH